MIFIYRGSLAMKLMTFMINIVQSIINQAIPWQSWTFPIVVACVVMETGTWVYWHYWELGYEIMALPLSSGVD